MYIAPPPHTHTETAAIITKKVNDNNIKDDDGWCWIKLVTERNGKLFNVDYINKSIDEIVIVNNEV